MLQEDFGGVAVSSQAPASVVPSSPSDRQRLANISANLFSEASLRICGHSAVSGEVGNRASVVDRERLVFNSRKGFRSETS